jgi:hypothetical protein
MRADGSFLPSLPPVFYFSFPYESGGESLLVHFSGQRIKSSATRNSASFSSFQLLFEVYGARGIFPKGEYGEGRFCKVGLREEEI